MLWVLRIEELEEPEDRDEAYATFLKATMSNVVFGGVGGKLKGHDNLHEPEPKNKKQHELLFLGEHYGPHHRHRD